MTKVTIQGHRVHHLYMIVGLTVLDIQKWAVVKVYSQCGLGFGLKVTLHGGREGRKRKDVWMDEGKEVKE